MTNSTNSSATPETASRKKPIPPPEPKGKVWLITSASSPLGFSVARQALRRGDSIAAGCTVEEYDIWRHKTISGVERVDTIKREPVATEEEEEMGEDRGEMVEELD